MNRTPSRKIEELEGDNNRFTIVNEELRQQLTEARAQWRQKDKELKEAKRVLSTREQENERLTAEIASLQTAFASEREKHQRRSAEHEKERQQFIQQAKAASPQASLPNSMPKEMSTTTQTDMTSDLDVRGGIRDARFPTGDKPPNGKAVIYTAKRGDTLWDISRLYSLDVKTLQEYNGLSGSLILVGQQLVVGFADGFAEGTE